MTAITANAFPVRRVVPIDLRPPDLLSICFALDWYFFQADDIEEALLWLFSSLGCRCILMFCIPILLTAANSTHTVIA